MLPPGKLSLLACLVAFCGSTLAGCQPVRETPVTGVVSGTVTIDGKPLSAGVVNLDMRRKAIGATAVIKNGQFTIDGPVSSGLYKATVLPPEPMPPAPGEPAHDPVSTNIPARYQSVETTDLEVRIDPGENQLQLDLKS